jgi:1A family penicillin-binding protein
MYVPALNLRGMFRNRRPFKYLLLPAVVLVVAGAIMFDIYNRSLPDISNVAVIGPVSSKVLDRNGVLLYEIHGETKRTPVDLTQISQNLVDATVAIEDENFYHHHGVSPVAIARAAYANYKAKEITQGGSTITQQLVKLSLLTSEKSYERKIKEAILALKLEHRYSKDEILEMYLNRIPYGRNTYGAEAASLAYFAKPARDLTLAESAYLAALPKAPSLYSPTGATSEELAHRKDVVLDKMAELGMISGSERDAAKKEAVAFTRGKTELAAPHFVKWVESTLIQQYGREYLEQEGLEIQTTLDSGMQAIAEKAVADGAAKNKRYGASNASLVAIEPESGYILAMAGSKDYFGSPEPAGCKPGINCSFDPKTNIAISNRQPGSSFKPYTYVTAFGEQFGYSPASQILDKGQNFSRGSIPYRPVNYSGTEYGLVSMRKALAGSLNIAAVRTLSQIGVQPVVNNVKAMGITTPMESCGLSLTLGACEVKLVEHVAAYSVLANMGQKANVTPLIKITDKRGQVLYEHHQSKTQVLNPQAAYEVVDIMSDNSARSYVFGARSPLILKDGRKVAAKTGTSQDFKDGWTIGFTPQIAAGVWVGNNDGRLMRRGADGVVVAAPIWNQFMSQIHQNQTQVAFEVPSGIQRVRVSRSSGKLATAQTIDPVTEVFANYAVPKQKDQPVPAEVPPVMVLPNPTIADKPAELPDIGGSEEPVPDDAKLPSWADEARRILNSRDRDNDDRNERNNRNNRPAR